MFNPYLISKGFSTLIVGISSMMVIDYFYKRYKYGNKKDSEIIKRPFFLAFNFFAILITLFFSAPFQLLIGLDNIYLKPPGEYCYNVKIFDLGTNKENVLPARIIVNLEQKEEGDSYGERRTKNSIHFYLDEIYNGSDLIFFYDSENELFVDEPVILYSYESDKEFECTLLNERAHLSNNEKFKNLKFDNGINVLDIIFDVIKITISILYIAIFFYSKSMSNNPPKNEIE